MCHIAPSPARRRGGRSVCLATTLTTSSRRWEANGILRTVVLMWGLRLRWFLGADVAGLARRYR
ncbi:MAG: glycosyl transferase, partial [Thiohalospira sp.]